MKMRNFFILFSTVFALVAMLVSCSYQSRATFPSTSRYLPPRPIETTMIEITGDQGEKLRVEFNYSTGECTSLVVNGKERACDDPDFVVDIEETYYCTSSRIAGQKENSVINIDGKKEVYCGNVKFLTDGTAIQFKADSAAENKKCIKIGGKVYCF